MDISEEFAHEKLSPILALYKAKTFEEAIQKSEQLVADGGYGHTASLYINPNEEEKIAVYSEAMKTCRILINSPAAHGGIGDLFNFKLAPSLTLGCGFGEATLYPIMLCKAPSQYQNSCRKERKYALVCTRKDIF